MFKIMSNVDILAWDNLITHINTAQIHVFVHREAQIAPLTCSKAKPSPLSRNTFRPLRINYVP